MTAADKNASSGGETKNRDLALLAGAVLVLVLIGFLVYHSHAQRVAEAAADQGQGETTKVVVNPRPESDTPQARELRQATLDEAQKWRDEMLAKPVEERTLPDGRVLVPEVAVYEDRDVYIPMRRMVPVEPEPVTGNIGMQVSAESKPAPQPVE